MNKQCPICNKTYTSNSCPNWRQSPHQRKFAERRKKWGDLGPMTKVTIRIPAEMLKRFRSTGGVQKVVDARIIGPVALEMAEEKLSNQDNPA